MAFQDIIFDLDGTLIDSLDDIAESILCAYAECGVPLGQTRNEVRAQLGHPIRTILANLTPQLDHAAQEAVRRAFRRLYDHGPMRFTRVYPRVADLLESLTRAGKRLYLATNKPEFPTRRILAATGLVGFRRVICSDSLAASGPITKTLLVRHLLECNAIERRTCILVGDTIEDMQSACDNGICRVAVLHGYGDADCLRAIPGLCCLSDAGELTAYLLG